jgi:hypothetical protein
MIVPVKNLFMRSYGCFTPVAFLLVVGWFLLCGGLMGHSSQAAWAGAGVLGAALILGLVALYFRWQGWD